MTGTLARLRVAGAILGIVLAAAGGAAFGVALGERASQPVVRDLVVADHSNAPEHTPALRSPGGFTGFEGRPGLTGRVFRVGEIGQASEEQLDVIGDGSSVQVRLRDGTRLFRLAPLAGGPAPGDVVMVRLEQDVVTGVLRVPPDLGEGEARGQRPPAAPSP